MNAHPSYTPNYAVANNSKLKTQLEQNYMALTQTK